MYKKEEELHEKSLRIDYMPFNHCSKSPSGFHSSNVNFIFSKKICTCGWLEPKEHPDTAVSCNNLARLYKNQGEYKKAGEIYEKSLRIMERMLGEEHPDTAKGYNNLAGVYEIQGEYKKAEELYKKSIRIKKNILL